jgi:Xaa-Pro aminopeptidase
MNYQNHRLKVLENINNDSCVVAVSAANPMQVSGSFEYPYRQDSNFLYLCGYANPDAVLMFGVDTSTLFVRKPDEHDLLWDVNTIDFDHIKQQTKVDYILPLDQLESWINQHKGRDFYVPHTQQPPHFRAQVNAAQSQLIEMLQKNGVDKIKDAQGAIAEARRVKDEDELALIEQAITVTHQAFSDLDLNVDYEYQLESQITKTFIDHKARHAYSPIVASSDRATILHYQDNDAALPDDCMVLIDAGAEVGGYAADVTRMFELGQPSGLQRQMLTIVTELQQRAIERVKPGVTIREFATEFREDLLQEAQKAGYVTHDATIKDTINLMPHGVCHYLGLEVHDAGDYEAPFEPGVVLMVEPGLYLFDKKLGVRLEDAVVVTDDGCRLLAESIQ